MTEGSERLAGRLDRLGVERLARAAGLPEPIAIKVAQVIVTSSLPDDRRAEVLRELIAHFEDGLAAGRTPEQLLAAFGDGRRAGALIGAEKRVVTSEAMGGTGTGDGLLGRLGQDVRYAFRRLLAKPAFTLTAVLSLALGIGANAAIFTLVNDVVFRRPTLREPERLIDIYGSSQDYPFTPLSYPDLRDLARRTDVFEGVVGSRMNFVSRTDQERPGRLFVQVVSGDYFDVLGVTTAVGRLFHASDAPAPGEGLVVVVSDRYWRRELNADPGVVGRPLSLTGGAYTIVGVAPADFSGSFRGIETDLYIPMTRLNFLMKNETDELENRTNHSIFTKARLRDGVSLAQARAAVATVAADLRAAHAPGWEGAATMTVVPTAEVILYPPVDKLLAPMAAMLMAVVGLVLVIACANLAGFLLARAVDRRKEIAIRLSLGATRARLVAQLLVETTVLGVLGGAIGVAVGVAALRAVLSTDLPFPIPIVLDLPLDGRVLGFSIAVSIVAGVLCGLAPALQSTRMELASVIRDESTGGGRSKGTLRSALVVGQVAVAVLLLVVAGLFLRSLSAIRDLDPGFGHRPTAAMWVNTPGSRELGEGFRRISDLRRGLAELPGVVSVGLGDNIHLNPLNSSSLTITVDGVEPPKGEAGISVDRSTIDTGYVAAFGLTLVGGRNLSQADLDGNRHVALVNEAFGERFWPGRDPVGLRYRGPDAVEWEIVGVVKTARIRSLAERDRPYIYQAMLDPEFTGGWLLVTGSGDDEALLARTLRFVREQDPDLMILQARTLRRHIASMALPVRFAATALAGFAILALIMASVGLYGTVSYAVAQRSREVGIRLSLGADRGSVIRLLTWGGLRLALVGSVVGLVLGALSGQLLESLLVGVRAFDPITLVVVPLSLVVVTALAAWIPARRAGRIEPIRALKSE